MELNQILDLVHYLVGCMLFKDDFQRYSGQKDFSRLHPFASWLGSMVLCFPGEILGNICVSQSPVAPFTNTQEILKATLIWYLLNFFPLDWTYNMCSWKPVAMFIWSMEEIHRVHKIYNAVGSGIKTFPNSHIGVFMFANLAGSGAPHMQLLGRLFAGEWIPAQIETLKPSMTTKLASIAIILFMLDQNSAFFLTGSTLFYVIVTALIICRCLKMYKSKYILEAVETQFCYYFFGGFLDHIFASPQHQSAAVQ